METAPKNGDCVLLLFWEGLGDYGDGRGDVYEADIRSGAWSATSGGGEWIVGSDGVDQEPLAWLPLPRPHAMETTVLHDDGPLPAEVV